MIKVVGIDISLNNLGVCEAEINGTRVEHCAVKLVQPVKADKQTRKQVRKNSDDLRRAKWLHDGLHEAIKDCHVVTIEMPVGSQSARAMASYGICIGVIASVNKPLIEVTPLEVKLAGAGHKTATKSDMIDWAVIQHPKANWLRRKFKGEIQLLSANEHLADALATIYAGMKTAEFKTIMNIMNTVAAA